MAIPGISYDIDAEEPRFASVRAHLRSLYATLEHSMEETTIGPPQLTSPTTSLPQNSPRAQEDDADEHELHIPY